MRLLEFLLFSFCLIALFSFSKKNTYKKFILISGISLLTAHLLLEGWRWQMLAIYVLSIFLIGQLLFKRNTNNTSFSLITKCSASTLLILSLIPLIGMPIPKHSPTTGEYHVGTSTLQVNDQKRKRILPTKIWYPIKKPNAVNKALWVDKHQHIGYAMAKRAKLPKFIFQHLRYAQAGYQTEFDAALISEKPILLLAHGRGAFKELNTFIALEFASHGYVVIAADHVKGAMSAMLEDGTVIPFDPQQFGENEGLSAIEKHQRVRELGQRWKQDLDIVLRSVKNRVPALQSKPVISAGHSTGGGAAIEFCHQTTTCLGTIGLDTWMEPLSAEVLKHGSNKPLLSMFSDPYEKDFEPINHERFEQIDRAMRVDNIFSKEIVISKAGHMDFCDANLLSPYSYLLGQDKGRINARRVHNIINQQALAFANALDNNSDLDKHIWSDFPESMDWVDVN